MPTAQCKQGTFESQQFKEKLNQIVIQVARAEPTRAPSSEAGVQNAGTTNGSATALVRPRFFDEGSGRKDRHRRVETVGW